jgi:ketosteroid isomerase-like protein
MNNQALLKKLFSLIVILLLLVGCARKNYQLVEQLILAKEKMLLDEWGKGHTMIFPQNNATEITYFDPSLEKRINGIKEFTDLLKPIENKFTIEKYEMLNPKVQVHGEVAVLSYNLVDYSKNPEGVEQKHLWNSTEVYKKINNDWKIIHSHWSFTKPELKK